MAALQKFKLLATQCGVAPSPTRSPTTSPLVHLTSPHKTTLRMLLSRGAGRRRNSIDMLLPCEKKKDRDSARHKLKDLFGLSSSLSDEDNLESESKADPPAKGNYDFSLEGMKGVGGDDLSSPRRGFVGFRYKALLKKSWKPPLETIPE